MGSPFMKVNRIVLALSLLITAATGQVNTEALRRTERAPGWHSSLGMDLGYLSGNTELLNLKTHLRVDYLGAERQTFIVAQYQRGKAGGNFFLNKGFTHFRSTINLKSRHSLEFFLQKEFNRFIDLDDRQLIGGGWRGRWPGLPDNDHPLELNTGVGLMWEREQVDTGTVEVTALLRSTNYLVVRWTLDDRVALSSTTYYQVDTRRFADFRILWEGSLKVMITQRLALTLKLNFRYDSEPPKAIESHDLEIINGLSYSL